MMRPMMGIAACLLLAGCLAMSPETRQVRDLHRILKSPSREVMQRGAERFFLVGASAAEYRAIWRLATEKEEDTVAQETLYHFFPNSDGDEGNLGIAVIVNTRSNTVSKVMVDKIIQ